MVGKRKVKLNLKEELMKTYLKISSKERARVNSNSIREHSRSTTRPEVWWREFSRVTLKETDSSEMKTFDLNRVIIMPLIYFIFPLIV